jgi:hypothetical protein
VKGSNQPLGLFAYDLDLTAAQAAVAAMAAAAGCGNTSNTPGSSSACQERRLSRNSSSGASASSSGAAAAGGVSGRLPAVRHSLAVLPGAAGAARSSVVVSSASQGWGADDEAAGPDQAEVRHCSAAAGATTQPRASAARQRCDATDFCTADLAFCLLAMLLHTAEVVSMSRAAQRQNYQ